MTNILQNNDTQTRIFIIKGVEAEIYLLYVAISGERKQKRSQPNWMRALILKEIRKT